MMNRGNPRSGQAIVRKRGVPRGPRFALNPKTWTSALLLFYLSPVFCRTHS
ncbi:hypothetical protein GKR62_20480, partial [Yersinia pseudotuberculosis]|nr:hypothetical protein [Yersinia pseudotuberculosis]